MRCEMQPTDLIKQQAGELRRFQKVRAALEGVVAFLWLPGLYSKFDGPRRILPPRKGVRRPPRPIAVTMEVTPDGGLTLGGAISRPRDGRLVYSTIFKYEFTTLMAPGATGATLSAENDVLARRALALLRSLVRFGEQRVYQPSSVQLDAVRHPRFLVPFLAGREQVDEAKLDSMTQGMHPNLVAAYKERMRESMCDRQTLPGTALVDSAIVSDEITMTTLSRPDGYEEFSPVLGVPHWNPAQGLHEMPNPASALLSKHGVINPEQIAPEVLDAVVKDFRATLPLGERLLDEEIYDALVHPTAPVICVAGPDGFSRAQIARAMRRAASGTKAAWEATDADLVRAARNPDEPLYLSRLSVTQLVEVRDLHTLPFPYAGDFLPPVDWQPQRRAVLQEVEQPEA